jgi:hypothetical protein
VEEAMPVTLSCFDQPIRGTDGVTYHAKACARPREDGRWEGWIEFAKNAGGEIFRTTRETTQPNLVDMTYWATGLTTVYLEGALDRALPHEPRREPPPLPPPAFDGPAEEMHAHKSISGARR